jgi:chromosome segregation ATPase
MIGNMISSRPDELTRIRALLQQKNDKLEDLRSSLAKAVSENARLNQLAGNQSKQLQILLSEKSETQQRFESTTALARKLDLKLQMTTARLDTASANEGLPDRLREAEDRLHLFRKKIEKQSELLQNLSEENAVLTRAISLQCRDAGDSVDLVKENAELSVQIDRMHKEMKHLTRDRSETVRLRDDNLALTSKLDRQAAKCEVLESQVALITQLRAELAGSERRTVLAEAKQKALKDDNMRLAENIKELRAAIDIQESTLLSVSHQADNTRHAISDERAKREILENEFREIKASRSGAAAGELRAKDQLREVLQNVNAQDELISRLQDEVRTLMSGSARDRGAKSALQDELKRQRDVIGGLEAESTYHTEELMDLRAMHHRTLRELEVKDRQIEKLRNLIGAETLAKARRLADN